MASSIFRLFHGCREDLWHPKALGFFALKLLLATFRVLKGATRGVHSAEEALVAAISVSCLERSARSVSSECWRNTSIPLLLPCDCLGEALIWYCPGLSWYHCCAHLLCSFCLFAVQMGGNQSFCCHLTPFTSIWKDTCSYSCLCLCKTPAPWWTPSTHWRATGDFNIVLLSYLKIWKWINHATRVPLLKPSVRWVKIGHSQRCGEICICFLGSHFLFLKFKIYNFFLVVSSTAEVKLEWPSSHVDCFPAVFLIRPLKISEYPFTTDYMEFPTAI